MAIRLSHQPTNYLIFFSVFYIAVIPQYNNIDFTVAYSDLLSYDGDRHYLSVMVINFSRLMRGNEKCGLMLIMLSGIMSYLSKSNA